MAVPNSTLNKIIFSNNGHDEYGYGDPTTSNDLAQSQISGNASNELDDQLQILFANRRIDQGYAKNEELDFLGVRGQNSLLNSHAHYNYLSSIINSVYW